MTPRASLPLPDGRTLLLYPDGDVALDGRVVEDPKALTDDDRDAVARALTEYVSRMHPSP